MKPNILITNDDGITSPGITALEKYLAPLGRLITVAPDREMSATSHRITVHQQVRYLTAGKDRFAVVEGSPADCVILASMQILKKPPALVVSGVNRGWNLGDDINYSGTVSAAFEAALQGIPAIAVSTYAHDKPEFVAAAQVVAKLAQRVIEHGLPPDVVLNVNFPQKWNGKVRVTRQGRQTVRNSSGEKSGSPVSGYNWLFEKLSGGKAKVAAKQADDNAQMTDYAAVSAGYVSVSPLHLDRTAHFHLELFSGWTDHLAEGETSD
jgi:5'-nucleotidase